MEVAFLTGPNFPVEDRVAAGARGLARWVPPSAISDRPRGALDLPSRTPRRDRRAMSGGSLRSGVRVARRSRPDGPPLYVPLPTDSGTEAFD